MKPIGSSAVFHVTDIEKAIEFYTENFGFEVDFRHGAYVGLSVGDVCLHLSSFYPYKNNTGHGNLYIFFEEVDDLYNRLVKAGVEFYFPIGDRDYGMRDFSVKDPDGNQIGLGASI